MTGGEGPRKKGGRPRLYPGTEKRPTLTFRVRGKMHEQLSKAAEEAERSLSEEIERRIEQSFQLADIKDAIDSAVMSAWVRATDSAIERDIERSGGIDGWNVGKVLGLHFSKAKSEADKAIGGGVAWHTDPEKLEFIRKSILDNLDDILVKLASDLADRDAARNSGEGGSGTPLTDQEAQEIASRLDEPPVWER